MYLLSKQQKWEEIISCTNNRESTDRVPVLTIVPRTEFPPSRSDETPLPVSGGELNSVRSVPGSESADVSRRRSKCIKALKSQNKLVADVGKITGKIYR